MTATGPDDRAGDDEAALAPFFAAARQGGPALSRELVSAILADAGAVSAARAAPVPAVQRPPARRPRAGFGGWQVATALAAASVFGFWVGLSGAVDLSSRIGWTGATTEAEGDPVIQFFDLASAE